MYHHIYPTLTDVGIEPRMDEDGEMRLIGVEATLEARILVCEEETVDILEDPFWIAFSFSTCSLQNFLYRGKSACVSVVREIVSLFSEHICSSHR